jgi:hypothetical protein
MHDELRCESSTILSRTTGRATFRSASAARGSFRRTNCARIYPGLEWSRNFLLFRDDPTRRSGRRTHLYHAFRDHLGRKYACTVPGPGATLIGAPSRIVPFGTRSFGTTQRDRRAARCLRILVFRRTCGAIRSSFRRRPRFVPPGTTLSVRSGPPVFSAFPVRSAPSFQRPDFALQSSSTSILAETSYSSGKAAGNLPLRLPRSITKVTWLRSWKFVAWP